MLTSKLNAIAFDPQHPLLDTRMAPSVIQSALPLLFCHCRPWPELYFTLLLHCPYDAQQCRKYNRDTYFGINNANSRPFFVSCCEEHGDPTGNLQEKVEF